MKHVKLPIADPAPKRPMRRLLLALVGLLVFCSGLMTPALAQQSREEFWPELQVYWRLDAVTRLFFQSAPARNRAESYGDGLVGAHVEFGLFPIFQRAFGETYDVERFRFLRFRLGVNYGSNFEWSTSEYKEWRGVLEATVRYLLWYDVLVSGRARAELRWLYGVYSTRYRGRLTVERETVVNTWLTVIPFAMIEVFYDTRYDAWSRSVSTVGLGVPIFDELVVEGNYNYQYTRFSEPYYVHAVGLSAIFYF